MYLEISVLCFIQLMGGTNFANSSQMAASALGLLVASIVVFFPIFTYSMIMSNFNKLKTADFHQKYGSLTESTKILGTKTTN